MIIDTGSSWTWTLVDDCDFSDDCKDLRDYHDNNYYAEDSFESDWDASYLEMISYHHKMSDTFIETDLTKSVTYASDHAINGQIVYDTATASTVEPLVAKGFNFMVQREVTDFMTNRGANSGILGLSPQDESAGPLFVSALYEQGQIGANAFSIILSFHPDQDSYFTFGGLPEFMQTDEDDFVCHRISGSFHWELKLLGF